MGAGRKTETVVLQKHPPPQWNSNINPSSARNLPKKDLAGCIFGCKNSTFKECLFKQLFGLPGPHFKYVQNVMPGMPLFLFNMSDRKLHGIYEATSAGMLNINSQAWTLEGEETTPFPAQVRVKVTQQCEPLTEDQFQPVIEANYRLSVPHYFWFELDKTQTQKLIALFSASPVRRTVAPNPTPKWGNLFRQTIQSVSSASHNERPTSISVQSNCSSTGDGSNVQEGTSSSQMKSWSSLFKSEDSSPKDQKNLSQTDLEIDISCQNQFSTFWDSLSPPCSPGKETERSEEQFMEDTTNILNDGDNTKTMFSDENVSEESNMEWDSSLELADTPSNAVTQEYNHTTSRICSEVSNCSTLSGYLDLEVNALRDVPFLGDANAKVGDAIAESARFSEEMISLMNSTNLESVLMKLIQTIGEMKSFQLSQEQKIQYLELELADSNKKFHELQYGSEKSGHSLAFSSEHVKSRNSVDSVKSVLLVGGFDGSSWLPDLDSYLPCKDVMESLQPMGSIRSYASAVVQDDLLYVLGGGYGTSWYNTVESYNFSSNEWMKCPSLNRPKGSLAAVCLGDRIFALGGGNATECFSEVEMLDQGMSKWIVFRSMVDKRFAPAAAELNGALYVVGGYNGNEYLKSMERLDPRDYSWTKMRSMNSSRGCHSLTVLNEKLYAIGGYDGAQMVPTVEVFEPRVGSWMMSEPMKYARGYLGSVTLGNKIYALGGMQENEEILDTVECYSEGEGWHLTDLKTVGKRCFFSAVVA